MDRYTKSREYLARAKKVTPGAAQALSKSYKRFPQGAFPVAVSHGVGATITDIDGNRYVDWIGSLGATPLGYGNRHVGAVVGDCWNVENLCSFSLPHKIEVELAERLCKKIPCAEMVRFVNSGSEATEAAIRTARIVTGRDIILTVKSGYHGWFSTFQIIKDWHPGIPEIYGTVIEGFEYNNLDSLEEAFERNVSVNWQLDGDYKISDGVAAVIMEPCLFEKPKDGFLQGVRDLCTKYGSLLIMDEMVLGFRIALAGGQEYFGVTPDLATFGKGMANGLPIGMLCGKQEYMQHAELISGTFGGNALSLAAANAVLDVYETEPVIDTMWKRGQEFQDYFNSEAYNCSVSAECIGYPCKPKINFKYLRDVNEKAMSLFLQVAAEYGMLWHPGGGNVCYALTDGDMDVTRAAISRALIAVRHAVRTNDWSELKGNLIQPVVTVRS